MRLHCCQPLSIVESSKPFIFGILMSSNTAHNDKYIIKPPSGCHFCSVTELSSEEYCSICIIYFIIMPCLSVHLALSACFSISLRVSMT